MTRGGRPKDRDGPERRCIVSGLSQPAGGLIRFVVGPEGGIVPDVAGKLPGRGIWVAADRGALHKAVARKLFSRAARTQVTVPEALVTLLETQLTQRLVELISLARRGGDAVCGYEKVREALMKGQAAVLVQAHDGSVRERARLRPPLEGHGPVTVLGATELGLAFGRDRVIHAALAAGGLASRVVDEARRLAGVRGQDGANGTGEDRQDA
ncbi:MAG: RNA-binding protein [Alkalilacustris sp.]